MLKISTLMCICVLGERLFFNNDIIAVTKSTNFLCGMCSLQKKTYQDSHVSFLQV